MKPIDSLSCCKRLEAAGMAREQAEALAQALSELMDQMVTMDELGALETRTKQFTKSYTKEQSQRLGSHADFGMCILAVAVVQTMVILAALPYLLN